MRRVQIEFASAAPEPERVAIRDWEGGGGDLCTQPRREPDVYRKGTLYFYNNTVLVVADQEGANFRWRTALFDADTSEETIDARNNIVFVRSATAGANPTELSWMRFDADATFGTP